VQQKKAFFSGFLLKKHKKLQFLAVFCVFSKKFSLNPVNSKENN